MKKIVILDSDEFSRKKIEALITLSGLDEHCSVVEGPVDDLEVNLCVGDLPAIDIRENDHFERPLRIGVLLDRVVKKQSRKTESDFVSIGPHTLNLVSSHLETDGEEVKLTEKEKNILLFLSKNTPNIVEREALLDAVWGYAETVETHTLETHIYRLRQKIEKDPANPEILITEEQGYRLGF